MNVVEAASLSDDFDRDFMAASSVLTTTHDDAIIVPQQQPFRDERRPGGVARNSN